MNTLNTCISAVGAVGAGAVGGVFLAFSTFVMAALRRLPPRSGLVAMQAINRAAPSPLFMTALFGTAVVAGGLVVLGIGSIGEPGGAPMLAGGALYLVAVVLTVVFHVPRNEALAVVDPDSPDAVKAWTRYAAAWTAGNHVRTVTSIAASAVLTVALAAG